MSIRAIEEHNKQLVRRIVEEMFNQGRLEVAPEIFGGNFVDRRHESIAHKQRGPDGFADFVRDVRLALPDIKATTEGMGGRGRVRCHVEYSDRDS